MLGPRQQRAISAILIGQSTLRPTDGFTGLGNVSQGHDPIRKERPRGGPRIRDTNPHRIRNDQRTKSRLIKG